jgi:hypothetical protein
MHEARAGLGMDETYIYVAVVILVMIPVVWVTVRYLPPPPDPRKCPKCDTANTVQRLNFVSEEDRKAFYAYDATKEIKVFVDCEKCGQRYIQPYELPQPVRSPGEAEMW